MYLLPQRLIWEVGGWPIRFYGQSNFLVFNFYWTLLDSWVQACQKYCYINILHALLALTKCPTDLSLSPLYISTFFLEFNTSWSMLWWSWQVWQILTMGDTRHVWITKYIRCDAWCGCHPPHHQLGGKYGLKIQMWWKWIKLPLTGPRQSTNYFDHFCLWDVCPAPVWHWRCRHPVSARGTEFLRLSVNILPDF